MQIRTNAPAVAFAAQLTPIVSKLRRKQYRRAYVEANIAHGIAHQIRTMREQRGMTQSALARRLKTTQTIVSRLEDPSYGRFTLSSLLRVTHAFDVALLVKFVSFPKFLNETADKSPQGLFADSFDESLNAATAALDYGLHGVQAQILPNQGYPFIDVISFVSGEDTSAWTPLVIDVLPLSLSVDDMHGVRQIQLQIQNRKA